MYLYTYIILSSFLLILWFILFFCRKDTRREMLTMSIFTLIIWPPMAYLYTYDWWMPQHIFWFHRLWIEDFLFSFTIGWIWSVLYVVFFHKKVKISKRNNSSFFATFLILSWILVWVFFGVYFFFHVNTFVAWNLAISFPILYIPTPN